MRIWATAVVVVAAGLVGVVAYRATRPVNHAEAGYAALRKHDNREAIEHLRIATSAEPNAASLHYDLGIAYENSGWIDQALVEFDKAVLLEPRNGTFRAGLAQTKRTLGFRAQAEKRHADAVKLYQGALLLAPDDAVTWYNLSVELRVLGRNDEAAKALLRASELDPQHYKPDPG